MRRSATVLCLLAACVLSSSACRSARPDPSTVDYSGFAHHALGGSALEIRGSQLHVRSRRPSQPYGVQVETDGRPDFDIYFAPVRVGRGAEFSTTLAARIGSEREDIITARHRGVGDGEVALDFGLERVAEARIEYYREGRLLHSESKVSGGENIWWVPVVVYVLDHVDGHYESETTETTHPDGSVTKTTKSSWGVSWNSAAPVKTSGGKSLVVDLVKVVPEAVPGSVVVEGLKVTAAGIESFAIAREESSVRVHSRARLGCYPRGGRLCDEDGFGCLVMFPEDEWGAMQANFGRALSLSGVAELRVGERPTLRYVFDSEVEIEALPVAQHLRLSDRVARELNVEALTILKGRYPIDRSLGRFGGVAFDLEINRESLDRYQKSGLRRGG